MKTKTMKTIASYLTVFTALLFVTSCSKDDPAPTPIEINIAQNGGDAGATFIGQSGSGSKTVTWNNSLSNMNWDMNISNATSGTFRLQVWDSQNTLVLDKTLTAGSGINSLSGTTTTGTASGAWKITVTVNNFKGTGSFSITPA